MGNKVVVPGRRLSRRLTRHVGCRGSAMDFVGIKFSSDLTCHHSAATSGSGV